MKASIISLGLAATVSAQTGYPLTTSTVYATSVYTITSCAPTVTDCPGKIGSVTTDIISLYTTVCPVTATETGAPYPTAPYPTGTASGNGTVPSYPVETYAPESPSTTTIYDDCETSTEVPTYPPGTGAPTSPATYTPAGPIISTSTISTCIPTVTTTVITVYPTEIPLPTYPVGPTGTSAPSASVYPTTTLPPFVNGAGAKKAGGLLMVVGIAAALL